MLSILCPESLSSVHFSQIFDNDAVKWFLSLCLSLTVLLAAACNPLEAQQPDSSSPYAFLYALSGYRYADFAKDAPYEAQIYVVDVDDSQLTASQLETLTAQGKRVYSYLSIGEAENYRDYWQGWKPGAPEFVLHENPDWQGNYLVKFWEPVWQQIIFERVKEIARLGYSGVYLDIVDAYRHAGVQKAYAGTKPQLRKEMEDFVIRLSQVAKSINPGFHVIPQNAVQLAVKENDEEQANLRYLQAIDGFGIEDLWYADDEVSDWTKWDVAPLKVAQKYGKFVLATSYPTESLKQKIFVRKALKEGFIPFVGNRSLSKKEKVDAINQTIKIPRLP